MAIGNYVLLEYGWNGDINDTAGFSKPFLLEKLLLYENPWRAMKFLVKIIIKYSHKMIHKISQNLWRAINIYYYF